MNRYLPFVIIGLIVVLQIAQARKRGPSSSGSRGHGSTEVRTVVRTVTIASDPSETPEEMAHELEEKLAGEGVILPPGTEEEMIQKIREARAHLPEPSTGSPVPPAPPPDPASEVMTEDPAVEAGLAYAMVMRGPTTPFGTGAAPADLVLEIHAPGQPPRTIESTITVPDGKWPWLTVGLRLPIEIAADGSIAVAWDQL